MTDNRTSSHTCEDLFTSSASFNASSESDTTPSSSPQISQAEDEFPPFSALELPSELLETLKRLGFRTPTEIQAEAIPELLHGNDVVGVAQTGTGKTAAYGIPLLAHCDWHKQFVQALILAPTRELAIQVGEQIKIFGENISQLGVAIVYGGAAYGPQIGALEDGAQVVVGTPGRVRDLINKGKLDLSQVTFFVLDEADEMLSMGFDEEVEEIASNLGPKPITALFSATMKKQVAQVAAKYIADPVHITVTPPASVVETVEQTYAVVPVRHKLGALYRVIATSSAQAAIVFVRTRSTAEDVAIELSTRGIQAAAISGDVPQRDREKLIDRLRSGTINVLVATDVAARGIDVERIGLVVNFDVPRETDAYIHRVGRTGRAGRDGIALSFFTPKEHSRIKQIERATGTNLTEVSIPSPAEVSRHRAKMIIEKLPQRIENGRLDVYFEVLEQVKELELEELCACLLALAVGDTGPRKSRGTTVETEDDFVEAKFADSKIKASRASGHGNISRNGSAIRYRIEVGHKDRVSPGAIVGAITGEAGISGTDVGKIDILPTFSLVDIHVDLDEKQLRRIRSAEVAGRKLRLMVDRGPGKESKRGAGFLGGRSGSSGRGARRSSNTSTGAKLGKTKSRRDISASTKTGKPVKSKKYERRAKKRRGY